MSDGDSSTRIAKKQNVTGQGGAAPDFLAADQCAVAACVQRTSCPDLLSAASKALRNLHT
eukprot:3496082-Rhodomonas_salina.2